MGKYDDIAQRMVSATPSGAAAPAPSKYNALALAVAPQASGGSPHDLRQLGLAPPKPEPSSMEALLRGGAEGATANWSSEVGGALRALLGGNIRTLGAPEETMGQRYRRVEPLVDAANKAAEKAHPGVFSLGQLGGGVVTGALIPGAAATTLGKGALLAGTGALAGAGASEKESLGQALTDTAGGAAMSLVGGAVGAGISAVAPKAAKVLLDLGRGRLFKAAVGQNKKAFVLLNKKQLYDDARVYLDKLGIGAGDSTKSISQKLATRQKEVGGAIDEMLTGLDAAGAPGISPMEVALRVEKEVAEPLRKLAAAQGEAKEVASLANHIADLGDNLSFRDAAAQRKAFQDQVNYDSAQKRSMAAAAKAKIAQIWNEAIDAKAAPLLEQQGQSGAAYHELRKEYGLVSELTGHSTNRALGDQANRVLSPTDYGAGFGALLATENPYMGLVGAVGNHVLRTRGNAAMGRAAINAGKGVAALGRAAPTLAASAARANPSALTEDEQLAELRAFLENRQN